MGALVKVAHWITRAGKQFPKTAIYPRDARVVALLAKDFVIPNPKKGDPLFN